MSSTTLRPDRRAIEGEAIPHPAHGRKPATRTVIATAVAAATLSLTPTFASAAVQIGQLPSADPDGSFVGNVDLVQETVGGAPGYQVPPGGGVITAWQHRGDVATPGSGRLQVWLPPQGTPKTLAGRSGIEAFTAGAINNFATRIPVAGGEHLGLRTVSLMSPDYSTLLADDVVIYDSAAGADPAAGDQSFDNVNTVTSRRLNVAATVEPDADGDGFGDETQDACPEDAATQDPCADVTPPDTTITAGPRKKTKKTFVTFEFISSEAASDFECSFDGAAFRPCVPPEDEKVGRGKHEFAVRAVDAAGNADASPATQAWKVRKKKRR